MTSRKAKIRWADLPTIHQAIRMMESFTEKPSTIRMDVTDDGYGIRATWKWIPENKYYKLVSSRKLI